MRDEREDCDGREEREQTRSVPCEADSSPKSTCFLNVVQTLPSAEHTSRNGPAMTAWSVNVVF